MPKILFLGLHRPKRSPSQRFRFEQYLDYIQENDFDYEFGYLLNKKEDKLFYAKGNHLAKLIILIKSWFYLKKKVRQAKNFDLIYVQRECFMLGTAYFEKQFSKYSKLIFDFDDAIWIDFVSANNKGLSFLKNAAKTNEIIKHAHMVFAGNQYLVDHAKQFNENVKLVPTTIDTQRHNPIYKTNDDPARKTCIGWTGTFSTISHLETILPVLKKLQDKYQDKIYFKVISSEVYQANGLDIKSIVWNESTEIEDLCEMDIGIMPLIEDRWTKGKCGLKALQFMALKIPAVVSPVGVNSDIIQQGENGMLASTDEEWFDKLSQLIDNQKLRFKIGKSGRETVLDTYSVEANKKLYLDLFNEIIK